MSAAAAPARSPRPDLLTAPYTASLLADLSGNTAVLPMTGTHRHAYPAVLRLPVPGAPLRS
jgi:hypothetical protein